MCITNVITVAQRESIKVIVGALFADGKSPLTRYGIDADKIERIEISNPQVGKIGVPLTHPLDTAG